MGYAAVREMEYLSALRGGNIEDANLVRELGQRLEALRRYDQYFCDADWQPRSNRCSGDAARKRSEA